MIYDIFQCQFFIISRLSNQAHTFFIRGSISSDADCYALASGGDLYYETRVFIFSGHTTSPAAVTLMQQRQLRTPLEGVQCPSHTHSRGWNRLQIICVPFNYKREMLPVLSVNQLLQQLELSWVRIVRVMLI